MMKTGIQDVLLELATIEGVTEDGEVSVRWAEGRVETLRVPLEQVPRMKRLIGRADRASVLPGDLVRRRTALDGKGAV
jgi:hypothetical protein